MINQNQNNISLDKVVAALEACSLIDKSDCSKCYLDGPGFGFACRDQLMRNTLALLKSQKPRVMTLEEYKAWADIPFCERDPIFHEMRLRRGPVTGWTNTAECSVENYGKTERCWTSRPTEAEREAVKWE